MERLADKMVYRRLENLQKTAEDEKDFLSQAKQFLNDVSKNYIEPNKAEIAGGAAGTVGGGLLGHLLGGGKGAALGALTGGGAGAAGAHYGPDLYKKVIQYLLGREAEKLALQDIDDEPRGGPSEAFAKKDVDSQIKELGRKIGMPPAKQAPLRKKSPRKTSKPAKSSPAGQEKGKGQGDVSTEIANLLASGALDVQPM